MSIWLVTEEFEGRNFTNLAFFDNYDEARLFVEKYIPIKMSRTDEGLWYPIDEGGDKWRFGRGMVRDIIVKIQCKPVHTNSSKVINNIDSLISAYIITFVIANWIAITFGAGILTIGGGIALYFGGAIIILILTTLLSIVKLVRGIRGKR